VWGLHPVSLLANLEPFRTQRDGKFYMGGNDFSPTLSCHTRIPLCSKGTHILLKQSGNFVDAKAFQIAV
jgi:hypothetical protein